MWSYGIEALAKNKFNPCETVVPLLSDPELTPSFQPLWYIFIY
jgi:hypothetical protein